MTFSPFDHPHFATLFGRDDLALLFAPETEIDAMLRFEEALALAEADLGVIPKEAAAAIAEAIAGFAPDVEALKAGVARDGLVAPALIAELRATLDEAHRPHLHKGATSQDVIDTGLVLRLKAAIALLSDDIGGIIAKLDRLADGREDAPLMGRTRMQRALPIRLADRIGIWRHPLVDHLEALAQLKGRLLAVQLGGPVGTLETLGAHGPRVRARLAERLELADPGRSWHTERGRVADIAHWLSKVSGSLGKIGQDVVLMAQNEIGEAAIGDGGRSSAMPHKRNPVLAELLIALARYNAAAAGAMHQALVHEGERSGSAWALEWLTLPPMIAATGAALSIANTMLDKLEIHAR
ncbi:MAG: 3-carboxy-cis,cis-muconate cycloisomerase [Alphaproteobacteria bacterium]|nr:3-carboxy-cis,cis-muconate cycloisomerase [Alphaproteobacteria bacterium]